MSNRGKGALALLAFFLLLLFLKPSLLGTAVGSISFTESLGNAWNGFGLTIQMIAIGIVFILIIAFLAGHQKS